MTTLPNMGLVLPTRGPSGAGIWGDTEDENLVKEDAHDHTSGKGVQVPTAGIGIDADLSFGDSFAPIDLHRVQFNPAAALVSNAQNFSLFVSFVDGELYWRTNGGVNVKLTNGSALNVVAFAGGIGGDYTAVSAALNFDSAGNRYTLRDAGGAIWARMASGEVRIFETGTNENLFVGLAAPAALASSYTLTLPLALPGSTQLMQVSSAGVISASNTIANAVTMQSTLNVTSTVAAAAAMTVGTTLGVTGAATLSSTLAVTGLTTATGGISTTSSFQLTGADTVRHPARTISLGPGAFAPLSTGTLLEGFVAGAAGGAASGGTYTGYRFGANGSLLGAIPLRTGDRITNVVAKLVSATGSTTTTTVSLQNQGALSSATFTGIRSQATSGVSLSGMSAAITAGNTTINSGDAYSVLVECNDAANNMHLVSVDITYDRP